MTKRYRIWIGVALIAIGVVGEVTGPEWAAWIAVVGVFVVFS